MGLADDLLEKMYRWIEQREECASKLEELAGELEAIRERCNTAEVVGNSVSVVGALGLVGAGVATLLTGGAAAPLVAIAAATVGGLGAAVTVGTKITEHFVSSGPMKEAEQIESRSNETATDIKRLSERLKDEIRRENPSANLDKLDRLFMFLLVKAVARRNSIDCHFNFSDFDPSQTIVHTLGTLSRPEDRSMVIVAGVLAFFAVELSGKKSSSLFALGTRKLLKEMSSIGFRTALKGSGMVAGGVLGMAFALPDAIDSWKELIKNNHVTEASQSLRDTARNLREMSQTLRRQLNNIKTMLKEMPRRR